MTTYSIPTPDERARAVRAAHDRVAARLAVWEGHRAAMRRQLEIAAKECEAALAAQGRANA